MMRLLFYCCQSSNYPDIVKILITNGIVDEIYAEQMNENNKYIENDDENFDDNNKNINDNYY